MLLTAMSWEGHTRFGRGAIYANNQARPGVKRGSKPADVKSFGGAPTMYVPLNKYSEREPKTDQEQSDLEHILKRIKTYDPEKEFVVIFEAAGLMGADVVKPSLPPAVVHKEVDPKVLKSP
jgi:hypothetical protein